MSYEGYSQFLCKYGHYWTKDCYQVDEYTHEFCPYGHPAVWENMVNVTNGSFEGNERIDGYVELEIVSTQECKTCGAISDVRYKIPKRKKSQK